MTERARSTYPVMLPGENSTTTVDDVRTASELDQTALFERLQKWWRDDRTAQGDWREEAETCFRFVAGGGGQWNDKERTFLEGQGRVPVEFNRVGVHVDAVCGLEVTGRQEVRAIPVGMEDVAASEVGTGLLEFGRDGTDAEDEESDAFRDTVICGMGWIETRLNDDGAKALMERIDPLEMAWDCTCKRRNLEGARRVAQARELDLHEAQALWPGKQPSQLHAGWARIDGGSTPSSSTMAQRDAYHRDGDTSQKDADIRRYGKVLVVEMQWLDYQQVVSWVDPLTKQPDEAKGEEAEEIKERLETLGVLFNEARRKVWMRAFVGNEILESKPLPVQNEGFTKKCITGKLDQSSGTFYGVVRASIDPQRWANKWLSQGMHMLNTGAKKAWLVEEDALPEGGNISEFAGNIGRVGSINIVAPGSLTNGKIREVDNAEIPASLNNLLQFALTSIRDCMGVNLELMGQNNNDQAASLEYQRRQSASTVLAIFFDNLRRYRKEQSRFLMALLLLLDDRTLCRALSIQLPQGMSLAEFAKPIEPPPPPDPSMMAPGMPPPPMPPPPPPELVEMKAKAAALVAIKQQGAMGFDITVDEAASSPNAKERTWSMLMQLGKLGEQMMMMPGVAAEVVKYSPLPSALADKIREALEKSQEKGPPEPTPKEMAETELKGAQTRLADAQAIEVIGKVMEPRMPPGMMGGLGGANGAPLQ